MKPLSIRSLSCLSVLLLSLAVGVACYRPQVVAGPSLPRELAGVERANWPALPGMRLHVFNTGMNRVSPLLVGDPAPWRPAPAFVIEHPSRGLVVFDCGLGPEIGREAEGALHPVTRWLFQTRSLAGADLPSQMKESGLSASAVRAVILSHLHFDHVGGADAFRNARFIVGAGEREASRSRMNGFEPAHTDWIGENQWQQIEFASNSAYATFDASFDLFGDSSIVIVRGGGHTPGGIAALLALPGGPVLLAGDLVVSFDWLENNDVQRLVVDAERAAEVRNRVRLLRELVPAVVVVPGHDLGQLPSGRADITLHHAERFTLSPWPISSSERASAGN